MDARNAARPARSLASALLSRIAGIACAIVMLAMMMFPGRADAGAVDGCMQDAYGSALNCTANDISLAAINVLEVVDGCSGSGDTAQLKLSATLDVTANKRYDVGWYLAL